MSEKDAGARPDGNDEPVEPASPAEPAAPAAPAAPAEPARPADTAEPSASGDPVGPVSPVSAVASVSDDVDRAAGSSALPGEHRGGFTRPLTEPVPTAETVQPEPEVRWAPTPAPMPRSAGWALGLASIGLCVSLLVGWGFVIGLVAVVLAILALRRPWESTGVAVWALCLAVLSLIYSAGWLWWAWTRIPIVG